MADIQVYCYKNCPICGKELIKDTDLSYEVFSCLNRCYLIVHGREKYKYGEYTNIYIFGYAARIWEDFSDKMKRLLEDKVRKKIVYWRENDRYLMKLLEDNNSGSRFGDTLS